MEFGTLGLNTNNLSINGGNNSGFVITNKNSNEKNMEIKKKIPEYKVFVFSNKTVIKEVLGLDINTTISLGDLASKWKLACVNNPFLLLGISKN